RQRAARVSSRFFFRLLTGGLLAESVTHEVLYERRWALTVIEQVLAAIRQEWREQGREPLFDALARVPVGNAASRRLRRNGAAACHVRGGRQDGRASPSSPLSGRAPPAGRRDGVFPRRSGRRGTAPDPG